MDFIISRLYFIHLQIKREEIVYEAALSWLASDLHGRSKFTAEVLSHVRFALIEEEFIDKCILEVRLQFSCVYPIMYNYISVKLRILSEICRKV